MTRKPTLASSVLLASILGLIAAPVLAGPHHCGPRGNEYRSERMEQNHKQLHDVLKITPDQEIVWKKLTESEHSMTRVAHESAEDLAKLTTPERGEKRLEHMKAEQAQMAEHVAAIKAFYAALTPEQKTTFDDFHSAPRDAKRVKPELPAKASQKL